MLISNKIHYFRNFDLQKYLKNFLFPVDIRKSKREEPPGPSLLGVKLIKV